MLMMFCLELAARLVRVVVLGKLVDIEQNYVDPVVFGEASI